MITDTTRRLLGIPDTFVDDIGGITLTSWWPLLNEAVRALPGGVVEIGADKGFTTRMLSALCSDLGSSFVSVDPAPANGVDDIPGVDHRRITSEAFFKGADIPAAPVWIVDGDHNYDTVAMELEGIAKATAGADCLIFLHDLGWPNGRRDFWYSARTAPADAPRMADGFGVSIDSEGVVPISEGIGLGSMAAVASHEGGPRNGVLTAVEDFLKSEGGQGWVFRWTPIFFGFGILVRESTLLSGKISALVERFDAFDRVREVIGPLEFNRLRLLQTTNVKWTESAAKDRRINEMESRLRRHDEIRTGPLWARISHAIKLVIGC
jgi:hypothetical protein